MLSKDHFSNVLNEPAGKVASQVLKWVVPQLIACWDDERIDIDRTLTRIITGIFHHPALRDYGDDGASDGRCLMFEVVSQWWGSKDERERDGLRSQLSRNGVEQGRNHKPGVKDSGHGCCKPLGMPTVKTAQSSGAVGGLAGELVGGLAGEAVLGEIGSALAGQSQYDQGANSGSGGKISSESGGVGKLVEEGVGGGILGAVVGGLSGGLLGGDFSGSDSNKSHRTQQYEDDGSYTEKLTETGYDQSQSGQQRYGQAEYSQTSFAEGGRRQQYQRYEQGEYDGRSGYGEQVIQETRPTYGGGYEQTTERRYERPGGEWESQVRVEGRETASGGSYGETNRFSGRGGFGEQESYGGYGRNESAQDRSYDRGSGYGRNEEPSYGGRSGNGREEPVEETIYGGRSGYDREEPVEERSYGQRRGYDNDESAEERSYGRGSSYNNEDEVDQGSYGGGSGYGNDDSVEEQTYGRQSGHGGGGEGYSEGRGYDRGYGGGNDYEDQERRY